MKRSMVLLAAALPVWLAAQDFGDLETRADEVAVVNVNRETLRALAQLCTDEKDSEFLHALTGVAEINVHAFSFHNGQVPDEAEISRLRATVVPRSWPKFLTSRSPAEHELVEGYLGPGGMALLSIEPGEVAVIRIVGTLSADHVSALGGHFGVPRFRQGVVTQTPPPPSSSTVPSSTAKPPDKLNFGHVVRDVEARQGVRHMRIPLFGLAGTVAFVASGGAIRGLDIAIFENAPSDFVLNVGQSVPHGWSSFVDSREGTERTNVWLGDARRRMHLLIATHDGSEGVLLTTR